jgi:hypothetical protein
MNITKTEAEVTQKTTNTTKLETHNTKQQNGPSLHTTEKKQKKSQDFIKKQKKKVPFGTKTQYKT